jgi:hypothetical protein
VCAHSQRKSGASEEGDGHENGDVIEGHESLNASHENGVPSGVDTTDAHEVNEAPHSVERIPDGLAENGDGLHSEEASADSNLTPKSVHMETFVNGDSSTPGGHDDVNGTDMPEGTASGQPDAVVPAGAHDSDETSKEDDSNATSAAEEMSLNSPAGGEKYAWAMHCTKFVLLI